VFHQTSVDEDTQNKRAKTADAAHAPDDSKSATNVIYYVEQRIYEKPKPSELRIFYESAGAAIRTLSIAGTTSTDKLLISIFVRFYPSDATRAMVQERSSDFRTALSTRFPSHVPPGIVSLIADYDCVEVEVYEHWDNHGRIMSVDDQSNFAMDAQWRPSKSVCIRCGNGMECIRVTSVQRIYRHDQLPS
jgi:hypothetical protein